MSLKAIICAHCGVTAYKLSGGVNRSLGKGAPIFCGRECSGLHRRVVRSTNEAKALKAEYDRKRRGELGEALKAQKRAAYILRVANDRDALRAEQRAFRARRREYHAEYCRRPDYRAKKRDYDRQHRAVKMFGPFAEAFVALQDLETEIASRASRYEIYSENGTLNKCLKRKREYDKSIRG